MNPKRRQLRVLDHQLPEDPKSPPRKTLVLLKGIDNRKYTWNVLARSDINLLCNLIYSDS